jgi:predicted  nucleic acid-binding Zn-ribbon protein
MLVTSSSSLERELRDCRAELEELREARDAKMTAVVSQLALSQEQEAALRMEVRRLQEQVASLSSEQEDLLVMLADQVRKGGSTGQERGII